MWEESEEKKGLSCCLVAVLSIVVIVGVIAMLVYSFFFALFSAFSPRVGAGDGTYHFPLRGAIVVNSPFDPGRRLPGVYGDNEPRPHYGTDFKAATGTEVLASADGVVNGVYESHTGGLTVTIDHGGGGETRYLHLSAQLVSVGDTVAQGQVIALSGNSGAWTSGPHLHFEIRLDGVPIDPMTVLVP